MANSKLNPSRYPGARWWKFDFHTHTPASHDYRDKPTPSPRAWLLDFMRAGIDCVAVTDHNTGEWVDKLKTALEEPELQSHSDFRELHLFPGVEITANCGTHILAIMDPSKSSKDIQTLLGAIGCSTNAPSSERISIKSALEVIKSDAFTDVRRQRRDEFRKIKGRAKADIDLTDTKRKLDAFNRTGHASSLQAQRHSEQQQKELTRQLAVVLEASEFISQTSSRLLAEDIPEGIFDSERPEDAAAMHIIDRLHDALSNAKDELDQIATKLAAAHEHRAADLNNSLWHERVEQIRKSYNSF